MHGNYCQNSKEKKKEKLQVLYKLFYLKKKKKKKSNKYGNTLGLYSMRQRENKFPLHYSLYLFLS
jgi:hypothetical protein